MTDNVIPFKVTEEEPEHIFSLSVYQESDNSYIYKIDVEEDYDDDELLSEILFRAGLNIAPNVLKLEEEDV